MPLVIGTAGHIDHGKTTLVKCLTGTDCDRLHEEKNRGITIELGFAELVLPSGEPLSVIDVPGHEKFVHTMVSGASGIDFVLLVIAADEGVMPQTREHLEICSLLGISRGAVVLSKTDLVDSELLELAREDIMQSLQGTFLEEAPVFPVSAHTGEGIPALLAFLDDLAKTVQPKRRKDIFRLPVDRIFSLKGHGTVVTGTMISGSAVVGEEVRLYPKEVTAKIRSLQNHGHATENALAGRRTAINLQGLAVEGVERGDVLAHPRTLFPSTRFVVELTCLASSPRPLKQRTTVHFHHNAKSVQAKLYFPCREQLAPGETDLCEIRFDEPLTGVFGDRCVLRSFSPLRTVAGGMVLHPLGVALRRKSPAFGHTCELLRTLAGVGNIPSKEVVQEGVDPLVIALELAGTEGAAFAELAVLTPEGGKSLEKQLGLLATRQQIFCVDKEERRYLGGAAMQALCEECLAAVTVHHKANPLKNGPTRQEMLSGWGRGLAPKLGSFVMERLIKQGMLQLTGDAVHLPEHKPNLAMDQEALRGALLKMHREAGVTPPNMKDALETLEADPKQAAPIIKLMQDAGELVKVAEGLWYAAEPLETIRQKILVWFETHQNIDLAGLKEITGLSRKYLVALLEHFDKIRFTARVGDTRILRDKTAR